MIKTEILDALLASKSTLVDGEFFSAASASIMAERIEQAILNKFHVLPKLDPDTLFKESIQELLDFNGTTV